MSSGSDDSKKHNARECLIEAASKLFARLGMDKTSTRDIAEESKVNISMISYHFGGKEGLYKQVITKFAENIEKGAIQILGDFAQAPLDQKSFVQRMDRIFETMIKTRIENPEISVLLAREKIEGLPLSRDIHEKIFYPLFKNFLALFEMAQKQKIIKPDINGAAYFVMMTEGLWGLFEMTTCNTKVINHCRQVVQNPKELKNQMLKIYVEGILL